MAFCQKCGAQIEDNAQFCGACGAPQGVVPAPADTSNDKLMGVLAYLGILVLIPILAAKDSKFARFHANQGLILLIVELACGVVGNVLGWIPVLGWIVSAAVSVVGVVLFVLAIMGIVNVVKYEEKELPITGKFRILK